MKYRLKAGYDILLLLFPGNDTVSMRVRQFECLFKKADMFFILSQQYEALSQES